MSIFSCDKGACLERVSALVRAAHLTHLSKESLHVDQPPLRIGHAWVCPSMLIAFSVRHGKPVMCCA